jgi:hypothetical protein
MGEFGGREGRPVYFQAAWIGDGGRAGSVDAVDRTFDVGLGDLGDGTANAKPTAGIDDEEAAVGILKDVAGMEIGIGGDKEILVATFEGGAIAFEDVADDFVGVEVGGEKVAAESGPNCAAR